MARLDGWVAKSQGDIIKGAANTLYPPQKYVKCIKSLPLMYGSSQALKFFKYSDSMVCGGLMFLLLNSEQGGGG